MSPTVMRVSNDEKDPLANAGGDTTRRDFIVGASALVALAPFRLWAGSPSQTTEETHTTPLKENTDMPLVHFDALEGRNDLEIKTLLDSAHRAIVKAFHINERDRYQVYTARPKARFIMQDTGLGIQRSDKMLIITVFSKGRPEILKKRLYQEMTEELARSAAVPKSDVMIGIVENSAADWTFGNGEAQLLTGDLP
jgi:phenylpyruvate tautomerase PptA (4-oxalocrotonate tautomerase family)